MNQQWYQMCQVDVQNDPVVVLVRHGTTPHNELALFSGWEDPPLAERGVEDAKRAGKLLKKHGFVFDAV
jgi:2,3-bisphosphoglycerate-dependent phosphoglycerate mutase